MSVPLILNPQSGGQVVEQSYPFIATNFGWLYLLGGVAVLLLMVWLAFGRYGGVKLGAADEAPEFST